MADKPSFSADESVENMEAPSKQEELVQAPEQQDVNKHILQLRSQLKDGASGVTGHDELPLTIEMDDGTNVTSARRSKDPDDIVERLQPKKKEGKSEPDMNGTILDQANKDKLFQDLLDSDDDLDLGDSTGVTHANSATDSPVDEPVGNRDVEHAVTDKGMDRTSADIALNSDQAGFTGVLRSPDGKEFLQVEGGQCRDKNGELVGHLNSDGRFMSVLDQQNRTDINSQYEGWKFEGTEQGKQRSFECSSDLASGKFFSREDSGNVKEYDVRLGMLIDKETGQQVGKFTPPHETPDGKLAGGSLALATEPPQVVPLDSFKNAVFDVGVMGQTGVHGRRLQGVCLGPERNADGTTKEGSGLLNLQDAREKLEQHKKVTGEKQHDNAGFHPVDWATGRQKENTEKYQSEIAKDTQSLQEVQRILASGDANNDTIANLRQSLDKATAPEDPLAATRHKLDANQRQLEELPVDTSKINGSVQLSSFSADGTVTGSNTQTVKDGQILDESGKPQARIVNRDGQMLIVDGSGKELPASTMTGAVWKLDLGGEEPVTWVSAGDRGIVSVADARRRAQAEVQYAQSVENGSHSTESKSRLEKTVQNEAQFKARTDDIEKNGLRSVADVNFLIDGPREVKPPVENSQSKPQEKPADKIELPILGNKTDPERNQVSATEVNGKLRVGSHVYNIENGVLKENGESVGKLAPGYVLQMNDGRQVRLQDSNRVLMEFSAGDKVHQIIGMGRPRIGEDGQRIQGGLVEAKELQRQANEYEEKAAQGERSYFASKPYLASKLGWDAPDDALASFKQNLAISNRMLKENLDFTFKNGFNDDFENNRVDGVIGNSQKIMQSLGLTSSYSEWASSEGKALQTQLSDSVVMGATTVATAGIGAYFSAAGMAGKGVLAAEVIGGGVAGSGISVVGRMSDTSNDGRNAVAGFLEGSVNSLSAASGRKLQALSEAGKVGMAGQLAYKVADATVQSTVNEIASAHRLNDTSGLSLQSIGVGVGAQLIGEGLGHGVAAGAGKVGAAAERRLASALGDAGTISHPSRQLASMFDVAEDKLDDFIAKNPQKFAEAARSLGKTEDELARQLTSSKLLDVPAEHLGDVLKKNPNAVSEAADALGVSQDQIRHELAARELAYRMAGVRQGGLGSDVINNAASGYGNGYSSEVPRAVDQEKQRIAAELGIEKGAVTDDLLWSRVNWDKVNSDCHQAGVVSAGTSAIGSVLTAPIHALHKRTQKDKAGDSASDETTTKRIADVPAGPEPDQADRPASQVLKDILAKKWGDQRYLMLHDFWAYAEAIDTTGHRPTGYRGQGAESIAIDLDNGSVLKLSWKEPVPDVGTRPVDDAPVLEQKTVTVKVPMWEHGSSNETMERTVHMTVQPKLDVPVSHADAEKFCEKLRQNGYELHDYPAHVQLGYYKGKAVLLDPHAVSKIDSQKPDA